MEDKDQKKRDIWEFSKIGSNLGKLTLLDNKQIQKFSLRKDTVRKYIESRDEVELRKMSDLFYQISGEYRRLVHYAAQILTYDFLIVPQPHFGQSQEQVQKGLEKILAYIKKAAIEETSYDIAFSVVKYGVFYGYEVKMENDQISMLELPINFCRSRYKVNGVYQVEFDLKYFDEFRIKKDLEAALEGFPKEFGKEYFRFKESKRDRWLELDSLYARMHKLAETTPLFSSIFLDLLELDEYQNIDKVKAKLNLYSLLVQRIPLTKDNELALYMEEIEDLHANMRKMVTDTHIDVITTPCQVESINVDNGAASRVERDNIEKATNMVYTSAGTPIALFNAGSHTGSVGLNLSVKVDESLVLPLLKQFEKWYNNKFAEIYPSVEFGILFPPITIFNRSEKVKEYRESAVYGFPTRLLALTALGIRQYDANFLLAYENEILELPEKMIPLSSAHTSSGESQGGRPESDQPLSDEGQKTKDKEGNKNRAKED